jgi:hypothetical protein
VVTINKWIFGFEELVIKFVLSSKIFKTTVTEANLAYKESITIRHRALW